MDNQHLFLKGLHLDADSQFQPTHTYPYAENWMMTPAGHLEQERYNLALSATPLVPRGATSLNGEIYVFSGNETEGEIGRFNEDNTYTFLLRTPLLGFRGEVSAVSRVDYRGHRLLYFADGYSLRYLDVDAPYPPTAEGFTLQLPPALPKISNFTVQDGGSLPSGVVVAAVRLLTSSKNATPFSLLAGPISLVDESLGAERGSYDGSPPQSPTSKSITFTATSLEGYAYVQLVVGTYIGSTNQLELHLLDPTPIAGRGAVELTYSSTSQHQESIQLSELLLEHASYVAATHLEQKDGILLAANLTAEQDEVNWQKIANSIQLEAYYEDIEVKEDIRPSHYNKADKSGGVDAGIPVIEKNDYKNPLTSALKRGYRRGETYSFAFIPIIEGRRGNAYHIPGSYGGGLTPYVSQAFYPPLGDYPEEDGKGTTKVRHHQMPSVYEKKLFTKTSEGYTLHILGVKEKTKPDVSSLTEQQRKKFTGYILARQLRTEEHTSVLSQGIAQPLLLQNGHYIVTPYSGQNGEPNTDYKKIAFYSPETILSQQNLSGATSLQPIYLLSGNSTIIAEEREGERAVKYVHSFLHYKDSSTLSGEGVVPVVSGSVRYIGAENPNKEPVILGSSTPYSTLGQNGYLTLSLDNNLLTKIQSIPEIQFEERSGTDIIYLRKNGVRLNQDQANYAGDTERYLYNLLSPKLRQYGEVQDAIYFPIAESTISEDKKVFFGGDTFMGRFAILSSTTERQSDGKEGMNLRTLNYIIVESNLNTELRHYLLPDNNGRGATVSYYPKSKVFWNEGSSGVMQGPPSLGHPNGYNKQYSFENNLTPYFPQDSSIERVASLPNRIAYSEQSVEGEQLDAYRIFLPNNYTDIPKSKGQITDVFVKAGSLFVHTARSLWKTFMNEATTQTTSGGEIVLGNGGLFPRPAIELVTVDGGFAGCQHPRTAINTPEGRYFYDAASRKCFLFSDTLRSMEDEGLQTYFKNLPLTGNYAGGYAYAHRTYFLTGLPDNKALSFFSKAGGGTDTWISFHTDPFTWSFAVPSKTIVYDEGYGVLHAAQPKPASITLITNSPPDASKVFDNLEIHSRNAPSSLLCGTQSQDTTLHAIREQAEYGQEPQVNELLYRVANHQFQLPLPRDVGNGRLKGKWLSTTLNYSSQTNPALLKLITVKLRASVR